MRKLVAKERSCGVEKLRCRAEMPTIRVPVTGAGVLGREGMPLWVGKNGRLEEIGD